MLKTFDSNAFLEIPEHLPVLSLRSNALLPGMLFPFEVGRERSLAAIDYASSGLMAVVCQRTATDDYPDNQLNAVGCAARILKVLKISEDTLSVIVQGLERITIIDLERGSFLASIECVRDTSTVDELILRNAEILRTQSKLLFSRFPELPKDIARVLDSIEHPGRLADIVVGHLDVSFNDRQRSLEAFPLERRIALALEYVRRAFVESSLLT
jgi:ATP-dependent Lon protease